MADFSSLIDAFCLRDQDPISFDSLFSVHLQKAWGIYSSEAASGNPETAACAIGEATASRGQLADFAEHLLRNNPPPPQVCLSILYRICVCFVANDVHEELRDRALGRIIFCLRCPEGLRKEALPLLERGGARYAQRRSGKHSTSALAPHVSPQAA